MNITSYYISEKKLLRIERGKIMEENIQEKKRFAVLIDSDNISPKYAGVIFNELNEYGQATYRRIYGNWSRGNGWNEKILLENSIMPIQQFSYTTGKNSTDMAMVIDAMDILYSGKVDGFCLVTSDSDFTRLAMRLREENMHVIGMGDSKAPSSLTKSCNKFIYLDLITEHSENEEKSSQDTKKTSQKRKSEQDKNGKTPAQANKERAEGAAVKEQETEEGVTKIKDIEEAINNMINNSNEENVELGVVGRRLGELFSDFDVRNYGYTKLSIFVSDGLKNYKLKQEGNRVLVSKNDFPAKEEIEKEIIILLEQSGGKIDNLSIVHSELKKIHPNFDTKDYGYGKFSNFIRRMGSIKVVGNTIELSANGQKKSGK